MSDPITTAQARSLADRILDEFSLAEVQDTLRSLADQLDAANAELAEAAKWREFYNLQAQRMMLERDAARDQHDIAAVSIAKANAELALVTKERDEALRLVDSNGNAYWEAHREVVSLSKQLEAERTQRRILEHNYKLAGKEAGWADREDDAAWVERILLLIRGKIAELAALRALLVKVRDRLTERSWRDHGHRCESMSANHAAIQILDRHLDPPNASDQCPATEQKP